MENLVTKAIDIVGISKLTKACGLASRNAIKTWEKSGHIPLDAVTDYPGMIEYATSGTITRAMIWASQLDELKPSIVYRVPIASLRPDGNQPRKQFDEDGLKSLAASLKTDGQESPIKFRITPTNALVIVHGERRFRASQIANLEMIDGVLDTKEDTTPTNRILRQVADNMGEPLSPWDWVETFTHLHDQEMTDKAIADELERRGIKGFSRSVIANHRRLLKLPAAAQDLIKSGWLTPSHGKYLLMVSHEKTLTHYLETEQKCANDTTQKPKISDLKRSIHNSLRSNCYGLTNYGKNGSKAWFDHETECADCDRKHEWEKDLFCSMETCWRAKQKQHEEASKKEREERDQKVEEAMQAEEEHGFFPIEDPDLQDAMKRRKDQKERREASEKHLALIAEINKRLKDCDPDIALALYCAEHVADIAHPEELSFSQIADRIKTDRDTMIRELVIEHWWLQDIDELELARRLGIDPDNVSPETSDQADLLAQYKRVVMLRMQNGTSKSPFCPRLS
ncbi:MAG: ParB/RepB/Spo0J family partition protein, partial [Chromatiales bacterium]